MISENRLVSKNEIEESETKLVLLEKELSDLKTLLNSKNEEQELPNHDPLAEKLHKDKLKQDKKIEELELEIENRKDIIGKDSTRNRGDRAALIICENKKDVTDIVKTLLIKNKHLYDFNGKVDGIRKVESGNERINVKEIHQLRPRDTIVATNVAGRGTDFKLSPL
jgi:superfamily II DNA or RNA helicase